MSKIKTIKSEDYNSVIGDFEVLVDQHNSKMPVIGIMVETVRVDAPKGKKFPTKGDTFIMPLPYDAAKELAETILKVLIHVAPEMFAERFQHALQTIPKEATN
jgi:hypothetical protein